MLELRGTNSSTRPAQPCLCPHFMVLERQNRRRTGSASQSSHSESKTNGQDQRQRNPSGNVIEHDGGLWVAVKTNTVKPGKGGAYNQVELKNLINGTKLNERFRSAETVEQVASSMKDFSFLYEQGDSLVFMDTESYEQLELQKDFVGDRAAFLQDGMMVTVQLYEESRSASSCPTRCAGDHRGRPGGEEPDSRFVLQAGGAGERHPRPRAALHRDRRTDDALVDTNELTYLRRAD
jgi:elongation factor P